MQLILSRKGFDSSAGKVPSPIFPDGTLLSLPIPDKHSSISYHDINGPNKQSIGSLVEELTKGKIPPHYKAHLDPDLRRESLPRSKGWKPVFGQAKAAQAHLKNHHVGPGDIFLFFGRFRAVDNSNNSYCYLPGTHPIHLIFGWLQVSEIVTVDQNTVTETPWVQYHPHLARDMGANNTLYIGSSRLALPGRSQMASPGAGVFLRYRNCLRLTAPQATGCSLWKLPGWFHPEKRPSSLSFHRKLDAWRMAGHSVFLRTASRGQEFVLNCDDYPEAINWVENIVGGF